MLFLTTTVIIDQPIILAQTYISVPRGPISLLARALRSYPYAIGWFLLCAHCVPWSVRSNVNSQRIGISTASATQQQHSHRKINSRFLVSLAGIVVAGSSRAIARKLQHIRISILFAHKIAMQSRPNTFWFISYYYLYAMLHIGRLMTLNKCICLNDHAK